MKTKILAVFKSVLVYLYVFKNTMKSKCVKIFTIYKKMEKSILLT